MVSVSRCRAAGRRWGAGVVAALQTSALRDPRHQTGARSDALALLWSELSSVVLSPRGPLRTRKPNRHAVVPVSSVVLSPKRDPAKDSPADVLQKSARPAVALGLSRSLGMAVGSEACLTPSHRPPARRPSGALVRLTAATCPAVPPCARSLNGRGAANLWDAWPGNRTLILIFACAGFRGGGYPVSCGQPPPKKRGTKGKAGEQTGEQIANQK